MIDIKIKTTSVVLHIDDQYVTEQVVITSTSQDKVSLYRKTGSSDEYCILPTDAMGLELDTITLPAITFMQLCKKYELNFIDKLILSTNDYDAHIIKSIDFGQVDIRKIIYVPNMLRIENYGRFWENARFYGINATRYARRLLLNNGYSIDMTDTLDTAIKR